MIVRVFAYGSNLDRRRMRGRVPSARFEARAWLDGWTLRFNKRGSRDGTAKANVVRTGRSGDAVPGVVYRMRARELPDLDRVEGGYDRVRSALRYEGPVPAREGAEGRDRPASAWIYVARAATLDSGIRPAPWYLEHVRRGAREHGLPASHLAWLEGVATSSGPGRH